MINVINYIMLSVYAALASSTFQSWSVSMVKGVRIILSVGQWNQKWLNPKRWLYFHSKVNYHLYIIAKDKTFLNFQILFLLQRCSPGYGYRSVLQNSGHSGSGFSNGRSHLRKCSQGLLSGKILYLVIKLHKQLIFRLVLG